MGGTSFKSIRNVIHQMKKKKIPSQKRIEYILRISLNYHFFY